MEPERLERPRFRNLRYMALAAWMVEAFSVKESCRHMSSRVLESEDMAVNCLPLLMRW